MRVVVGASLSVPPFSAGTAMDRIQYVLGLQALGHEAYLVEEVDVEWCVDPRGRRCTYADSVNRTAFRAVIDRFGLQGSACQLVKGSSETAGLSRNALLGKVRGADLLLNISGHVQSDDVLAWFDRRAYLDQDPVYTQLWHAVYGKDLGLERHDTLFTVGQGIAREDSDIPDCGRHWYHTLPPILPGVWPHRDGRGSGCLTTISSWGRYGDLEHQGRNYRSKQPEFLRLADLPALSDQSFEVALSGAADGDHVVERLRAGGWRVRNRRVVADVTRYRRYIESSGGEIGIAKGAYVEGRAGWIGDRSCHYLASGRPVLAQSTGIETWVPVGEGLLTFRTLEEAVEGARSIALDHGRHARRARQLAREVFDYRVVLASLLEQAMAPHAPLGASVR